MDIGKIIKKHRDRLELTQEELGKKMGVGKAAVNKWENGHVKNLKRTTIKKMAELFEIPASTFIDGELSGVYNSDLISNIPLIGTIAAGAPILAEENIEDHFYIDAKVKADFALRIKGDSMIDAGIFENDVVFLRCQEDLENGQIGAVLVEDEATLKKFYRDGNTIVLQSENDKYRPIILTNGNVRILGKLVAVLNFKDSTII